MSARRGVTWGVFVLTLVACGSPGATVGSNLAGAGGNAAASAGSAAASGSPSAAQGGAAGSQAAAGSAGLAGGGAGAVVAGAAGTAGAAGAPSSCTPARPHAAGDSTVNLSFGERARDYVLHVPTGYAGDQPLPLVLDLHGFTSWATEQLERTRWGELADANGFIVVEPDGFDKSWNAKVCCGTAQAENIDDVAFIREVVSRVSAELCIDAKRIYATGHSNGAMMTFRLGCEAADLFAAIAPVAGVTPQPVSCLPSRPLPVAMIRAQSDGAVPYEGKGTGDTRFSSAAEDLDKWLAVDGCQATPVMASHDGVCQTYSACNAGTQVMACSPRGDHLFFFPPNDNPDNLLVPDTAWPFFQTFSLP